MILYQGLEQALEQLSATVRQVSQKNAELSETVRQVSQKNSELKIKQVNLIFMYSCITIADRGGSFILV